MRPSALCLSFAALIACADANQQETPRPGIRFDPATVRPGTRVGALVLDSIVTRRTAVDSTYVGIARFSGRITLNGLTLRHPDADLRNTEICFEVDSASASQLPRWSGDERRPWFCFVNRAEAQRALGPPSEGVRATIIVEQFTIHRGLSDEVNSARLVRRDGSAGAGRTARVRSVQWIAGVSSRPAQLPSAPLALHGR